MSEVGAAARGHLSNDHDHDHIHRHTVPPPDVELRIKALESLLLEMGVIDVATMHSIIDLYERQIGPRVGARIVARAWSDPRFRERLLACPKDAIAELQTPGVHGEQLVVVENRPDTHNVLVCTLCSCYPWQTLGLPPLWYKSAAYRSRVVADPRSVLRQFGLEIGPEVEIHVWDSTADIRYMVLPERPAGTDHLTEDQLADLVTRDSMIGTGVPLRPTGDRA
jgi:nitrile hydratase